MTGASVVRAWALPPSASMTHTCSTVGFPSASVSSAWIQAIRVPSGDQAGKSLLQPGLRFAQLVSAVTVAAGGGIDGEDLVVRVGRLTSRRRRPGCRRREVREGGHAAELGQLRLAGPVRAIVQISNAPLSLEQ